MRPAIADQPGYFTLLEEISTTTAIRGGELDQAIKLAQQLAEINRTTTMHPSGADGLFDQAIGAAKWIAVAGETQLAVIVFLLFCVGVISSCSREQPGAPQEDRVAAASVTPLDERCINAFQGISWHPSLRTPYFCLFLFVRLREVLWQSITSILLIKSRGLFNFIKALTAIAFACSELGFTVVAGFLLQPGDHQAQYLEEGRIKRRWSITFFILIIIGSCCLLISLIKAFKDSDADERHRMLCDEFSPLIYPTVKITFFATVPRMLSFVADHAAKPVQDLLSKVQSNTAQLALGDWNAIMMDYRTSSLEVRAACKSKIGTLTNISIVCFTVELIAWASYTACDYYEDQYVKTGVAFYAMINIVCLGSCLVFMATVTFSVNGLVGSPQAHDYQEDTLLGAVHAKIDKALDAGKDATAAFGVHQYVAEFPMAWYMGPLPIRKTALVSLLGAASSPLLVKVVIPYIMRLVEK